MDLFVVSLDGPHGIFGSGGLKLAFEDLPGHEPRIWTKSAKIFKLLIDIGASGASLLNVDLLNL